MAFQHGLSGLNAASKNLDVIGHNIANANTTGFKASRAEFADMVASAIGGAGGSNVGIGVQVAAVAQQFSQGNLTVTGNNLDVAINGSGFFSCSSPMAPPLTPARATSSSTRRATSRPTVARKVMGYPIDPATGPAHGHRPAAR
jgi:flagellar hook protein FlgE